MRGVGTCSEGWGITVWKGFLARATVRGMRASRLFANARGLLLAASLLTTLTLEPLAADAPAEAQAVQGQHEANLSSRISQAQTFQAAVSGALGRVGLALGRRTITPGTATISV